MNEESFAPTDEREAAEFVRAGDALDIIGGGTRTGLGRPFAAPRRLATEKLRGIVFHEPAEMTLRALAGTPVAEIEAALAAHGQMLPFEPMDPRGLYGSTGEPTVGGLVATALAGPRRISAGGVRDNVLGLRFVNGAGEILNSGGRVTKNVTGLDLVKIQCGAQGTLGLILEATFKLLPAPRAEATVVIRRLDDATAIEAMTAALGSPYFVTAAATIHAGMGREWPRTLLRVEGFEDSVDHRVERLIERLGPFGAKHALRGEDSKKMWRAIRDASFVADPRERAVWRANVAPSRGAELLGSLSSLLRASLLDGGGGLVWLTTDPSETAARALREVVTKLGGHTTLMRGPEDLRGRLDVFEPLTPGLAALTRGVKASLDPSAKFNPGRMYAGV